MRLNQVWSDYARANRPLSEATEIIENVVEEPKISFGQVHKELNNLLVTIADKEEEIE